MKPNYRSQYVRVYFTDPTNSPSMDDTLTGYVTDQDVDGIVVANDEYGTDSEHVAWSIIASVEPMTDAEFGCIL